jgi:hypothetical protein
MKILFYLLITISYLNLKADENQQTWHLKDGSKLIGNKTNEDETTITLETSIGKKIISKKDIAQVKIEIILKDSSIIYGELLEENKKTFRIKTSIGTIDIAKEKVARFKIDIAKESKKTSFKDRSLSKFSHNIEPLIDIFFDPTGETFRSGDIYISGLSFAYGINNTSLISVDIVDLVGLNNAQEFNPNFELKKKILTQQTGEAQHSGSLGIRAQLRNLNGYIKNTYKVTRADDGLCTNCKTISREKISSTLTRAWKIDEEKQQLDDNKITYENTYDNQTGWNIQIYYAHTWSHLMKRGGRVSFHNGIILEANHLLKDESWITRPTFRVYSGFDMDVSKKFKILAEIFYDPSFYNDIVNQKRLGIDFGVLWAITKSFRLLLHVQPYIVGLYWRF